MTDTVETGADRAGRLRVAVFAVSSALLAAMIAVMLVPNAAGELVADWGGPHMIHDVMFTLFAAMVLVGLAVQIGAPRRRVAAMTLVLGFPVGVSVAGAAVGFVFPPLLVMLALAAVAAVTHPAARDLLRPQARPSWVTLGLATVWLIPAVVYAADHLVLQAAAPAGDEHAEFGHWVAGAVIALIVAALAVFGGLRAHGWRVPAWAAAATAMLLGAASIGYPSHASSFGVRWGTAAIAWGVALAAVSVHAPTRVGVRPDADRLAAGMGTREMTNER